ncbi:hypothetical protein B1R38_06150 [Bacillus cereus]|nr:hypothetical protein DOS87_12915 [Bacillus sp. CR71]AXR22661.1 hypothetical protein DPQ26_12680 [Bacillus sp. E25]PEQ96500.1 hypothetical protein CN477_29385 [Bacillus cereus]PFC00848.1 hypothetical protein CN280_23500 [Bacillus cereus]PFK16888.1 hypothetical protein COJ03_29750 [Bacillus cereus]
MKTIKGKLSFSIDIIGCILCIIMLIISLVNFRTWVPPFLFFICGLIFFINIINTSKGKGRNSN